MQKIPSLFKREHQTHNKNVIDEAVEGCEWVQTGEGHATIKYDGSAVLVQDGVMYKRLHLKEGRPTPEGWLHWSLSAAVVHGHGWLRVGDGAEDQWHREAFDAYTTAWGVPPTGTYEVVGPKINGNPERLDKHQLWKHGSETINIPRTYSGIKEYLENDPQPCEGVVFYHPDGRMAKVKRKDFGLIWPIPVERR